MLEESKPHPRAYRIHAGGPQLHRSRIDHGNAIAALHFGGVEHPPAVAGECRTCAGDRLRRD
jgi:hypothetical protein